MPIHGEFGQGFSALTAGERQKDVAAKLGVHQSSVSRMRAGHVPSRRVVSRIAAVYGQEEAAWLALAESEQDRLARIALRAAREALREAGVSLRPERLAAAAERERAAEEEGAFDGYAYFVEGLRRLGEKYGPQRVRFEAATLATFHTPRAQIDRILKHLEQDILLQSDSPRKREPDAAQSKEQHPGGYDADTRLARN